MRNLTILLGACIATAAIPSAAHAQSLDQVLRTVTGTATFGYDRCAYVRKGAAKTLCRVDQVSTMANRARVDRHVQNQRHWLERNDQNAQLQALQRACKAGDRQSCARTGGTSKEQMEIASALMAACRAGDDISCRRIDTIMRR